MLTLLTQRIACRLGTSSAVRGVARARVATTPIASPSLTRRTFLTGTPRLSFTAAAAVSKKPTAKKTTAGATGAKAGTKKAAASKATGKPKATSKEKKNPVAEKEAKKPVHPKLTKADMPPTGAPGPYIIFYSRYFKGLNPQPTGGAKDLPSIAREGAALWKSMSDVEKQPYKDEAVALKAAYEIKRQSYFDTVSPETLAEINRRRKLKGKFIVHNPVREENRRPMPSFFRYYEDFRNTPDGQALLARPDGGRSRASSCAATAGQRWTMMTDAQKAPYDEAAKKDLAAWKARKTA